jgi:hypothetical protein
MKILELYIGNPWGDGIFKEYNYDGISSKLELFDYSIYPKDSFDIIVININSHNVGFSADTDFSYLEFGMDIIEYYNPKFWLINDDEKGLKDDIIMWGLPYQDINTMRGGKLKQVRIWTNINRWKPKISNIYIKQTYILFEILQQCCQTSIKPI